MLKIDLCKGLVTGKDETNFIFIFQCLFKYENIYILTNCRLPKILFTLFDTLLIVSSDMVILPFLRNHG